MDEAEIIRYSRNILVDEIGAIGQAKLKNANILVIGAGGIGSPALFYLTAAGIGNIGVIDHDEIELSNLQRQILHNETVIGQNKAENAKDILQKLNSTINITAIPHKLLDGKIFKDYDLIIDGSDNFATRFMSNKFACLYGKILISAAVKGFIGIISTFKPGYPCYQCIFEESGEDENCNAAGVLGPIAGILGSMAAAEACKEIIGIGESLAGNILQYNALNNRLTKSSVNKDSNCPICA